MKNELHGIYFKQVGPYARIRCRLLFGVRTERRYSMHKSLDARIFMYLMRYVCIAKAVNASESLPQSIRQFAFADRLRRGECESAVALLIHSVVEVVDHPVVFEYHRFVRILVVEGFRRGDRFSPSQRVQFLRLYEQANWSNAPGRHPSPK